MKRIVFCFDGTWNRLDAPSPTNVVAVAQSVLPFSDGISQLIHYDQGVGTTDRTKWSGGLFGKGLLDNVVDAYTFLVFNYSIGDEIYVFGFSRGAFTARSFVGLLRNCGIMERREASHVQEAIDAYKSRSIDENRDSDRLVAFRERHSPKICTSETEEAWRVQHLPGYVKGSAPILRVRYLGVWDTVGSLGVPDYLFVAPIFNKGTLFHDPGLTDMVVSARHAVAIDEERRSFSPTLWDNFEDLNASLGFAHGTEDAPYQQRWFPGVHGAVGGGGDIRGLSDEAFDWILSGARRAGLGVDTSAGSPLMTLLPDPRAPLQNITARRGFDVLDLLMKVMPNRARTPGPAHVGDVAPSAIARWRSDAASLPEGRLYRPKPLLGLADALNAPDVPATPATTITPAAPPSARSGSHYTVKRGDALRAIALHVYGDANRASAIFAANSAILDDPDRIYIGQILYIP